MNARNSVEKVANAFSSLVSNPNAEKALDSVQDVEKIMVALDHSKQPQFREIFDKGIRIGELFKDPEDIKRILVNELGVFTEAMVDDLLEAKLNMFEILSWTGYVNLKGIACNGTLLSSYIIFPHKTDISEMAQSLCNLNSSLIPNITEMVQQQLNMARILKKVSSLLEPYEWAQGIGDLGKMIETLLKMPTAEKFLKNMAGLNNLPKLMRELVSTLQTLGQVNLSSSTEVIEFFDTFLKLFANNQPIAYWELIKSGLPMMEQVYQSHKIQVNFDSSDMDLNFGSLFADQSQLQEFLSSLNFNSNLSAAIQKQMLDVEKLTNILTLYSNVPFSTFLCQTPGIRSFLKEPQHFGEFHAANLTLQEILCNNPKHLSEINKLANVSKLQQIINDHTVQQTVFDFLDDVNQVVNRSRTIPPEVNHFLNTITQAKISKIVNPLMMLANGSSNFTNGLKIMEYFYDKVRTLSGFDQAMVTAEKFVQLSSTMLKAAKDLPNYLKFSSNNSLSFAYNRLHRFGPNVTQSVLTELINPETIKDFLENSHNVSNVLCQENLWSTGADPSQNEPISFCTKQDVRAVEEVLSKLSLDKLNTLFQEFSVTLSACVDYFANPQHGHRQKRDVTDIVEKADSIETIPTVSVSDSSHSNLVNLTALIEGLVSIYESLTEILKQTNMTWANVFLDSSPDNLKFLTKTPLGEHYMISSFAAYVLEWGPKLENSTVWLYIGPILKGSHVMIEKMNLQFEKLKVLGVDPSRSFSQLVDLLSFMLQYGPDFLPGIFNIIENPQMLNKLKSDSSDIVGMLCYDQQIFQLLQLPADVPLDQFQSIVCGSNLTLLIMHITSMTEVPLQVHQWLKSTEAVSLNWNKFITDSKLWVHTLPTIFSPEEMRRMMTMLMQLPSSEIDRLKYSLSVILFNMRNQLLSGDIFIESGIAVAKFLDEAPLLPNEIKKQMRHYFFIFDIYLDVTMEFISLSKENKTTMVPSAQILIDYLNQSMAVPKDRKSVV